LGGGDPFGVIPFKDELPSGEVYFAVVF
jgi:hypothetical protein